MYVIFFPPKIERDKDLQFPFFKKSIKHQWKKLKQSQINGKTSDVHGLETFMLSGSGLFLLGDFLLLIQIPYLFLVCWSFLFLLDLVLTVCMFLGIYPFLLGCPIFYVWLFIMVFIIFISVASVVMFPLSFMSLFESSLFFLC